MQHELPMSVPTRNRMDRPHSYYFRGSLLNQERFKLDERGPPLSDWRAHILRMRRRVRVRR